MTDHFVHVRGVGMVTAREIRETLEAIKKLKKRNRALAKRCRELEKLVADHKEGD